jgi:hypothetical protein
LAFDAWGIAELLDHLHAGARLDGAARLSASAMGFAGDLVGKYGRAAE